MGLVALSFVIPAYNEEASIVSTLCTLNDLGKSEKRGYEIILVNDGSRDKTLSRALKYASSNHHVKVVTYGSNIGKGHAVRAGFLKTTGDIVIFADSDLDVDLTQISRYVEALEHGDIVIASKWHPASIVDIPLSRRILSHSFNVLVRLLTGARFKDTQVGLKAMRKSAFLNIFPKLSVKRYAFDVELLAVASLYKLRIVELPTNIKISSSFRLIDVWRMFVDLLGIGYRLRVLRWYTRD